MTTSRPAKIFAAGALAALLTWSTLAAAQRDPYPVPVTADDSCEFGYAIAKHEVWNRPEIDGYLEPWVNMALGQVVRYCKPGSMLTFGTDAKNTRGADHHYYTVAASVCRRGDIAERKVVGISNVFTGIQFTCPIDAAKFKALQERKDQGRPLFHLPEDWVPGRPGDEYAIRTAPTPAAVPAAASNPTR